MMTKLRVLILVFLGLGLFGFASAEPAPASAPAVPVPVQVVPHPVNINTATRAQLEGLPFIGTVKAAAILKERELHGPFKDWDQFISRVHGFGPKTVEKLKKAGAVL